MWACLRCARWKEGEVPLVEAGLAGILPHHGVDGQVAIHQCVMEPPAQSASTSATASYIISTSWGLSGIRLNAYFLPCDSRGVWIHNLQCRL